MKEKLVPFENQRFRCLQCGECCRTRSVPLTMEDIKRLSKYKDPKDFVLIYNERKLVLERRVWDAGCVFLYDTDCTVQKDKPLVCQLYPACVSDKPLLRENKSFELPDGTNMFVYVDISCKGVGHGEPLDLQEITEKALYLRMQGLATDLGALVGWYIDETENKDEIGY